MPRKALDNLLIRRFGVRAHGDPPANPLQCNVFRRLALTGSAVYCTNCCTHVSATVIPVIRVAGVEILLVGNGMRRFVWGSVGRPDCTHCCTHLEWVR